MDVDTPRPSILVDDLDLTIRSWPKGKNLNYDAGIRFCFRPGKMHFQLWRWPWPEWIGIPTHETLDDWFDLIKAWKETNIGKYDKNHVDKCIGGMVQYL
jgi:hypothetical protein